MPKLSLSPKDATKGGGNAVREGVWEIGKAYAAPFQFPANDEMKAKGETYPYNTMVHLECYKLDPKTLDRVDDEPVIERLGFGAKNTMDKIRPGRMSAPDDEEPDDLGKELNAIGNSVYCEDGTTLNDSCSWIIFSKDLEAAGFKPEHIASGWLPFLEGTKIEADSHKAYKNPARTYKQDPTNLGVKKILVFGYEKKKGGKGKTTTTATAAATTAATATATQASAPANGAVTGDYTEALTALVAVAEDNKGKPAMKRAMFQANIMTWLMKNTKLDMKGKNELMLATVKDDNWLAEQSVAIGFVVDFGDGTLTFPK